MPRQTRTPRRRPSPAPPEDLVDLLALYDRRLRIDLEYPDRRREAWPNLVRQVRAAPGMNEVSYSCLDEAEMDSAIEAQVAHFRTMDQPFEWVVCDHDQPASLKARLIAHGFSSDDDPSAVMVLDLEQAPATLQAPPQVELRRLQQREELGTVVRILEQAIGGSFGWLPRRLGDHMAFPGYVSVVVANAGERPASCGWIYFYPDNPFAELFGGSTVPDLRGRGFYSAVLAARVQEAAQRGARYVITGASPMSRPILARNGFRLLTFMHSMRWEGRAEA